MNGARTFDRRSGVIDSAFFLALMAIASLWLWPLYETPRLGVLVVAGLALGALLAWLGALFRWPGYLVFASSVVVFLVFGVALAVPARAVSGILPSFEGVRELIVGSALGWKQLVTVDLPVSSYQALLAPALVLVFGGTVLGLSVLLRSARGALAIVAPMVVAVLAIVLGPEVAWYPLPIGSAFLVCSILWMTWRARAARHRAIALLAGQTEPGSRSAGVRSRESVVTEGRGMLRSAITATIVLAIAVAAGATASSALPPQGPRDVVRAAIERPFDPRDYSSPLSGFRSYWAADAVDSPLFTVEGLPSGARVRLATLDTYDGVVYSVGDTETESASGFFARVPSTIDRSEEEGVDVSAEIVVAGYTGVWLPTVGDLERIEFDGPRASQLPDAFYYNRVTGTAAVLGGVREGDGYTVEAIVPRAPDDDELLRARPGDASVPTPRNVPEAIATAVAERTAGLESPGEKLAAVARSIRASGYISHGTDEETPYSRSGHAADRITELLTDPVMLGDGEQYATAVALMADELGFPARVVLGFVPEEGSTTITGSDVSAWVEVDLDGYGWVALEATPEDRAIPEQLPEASEPVSRPQVVIPPPPAADDTPIEPNRPEADEREDAPTDGFWPAVLAVLRVVGVSALVLLVLTAPLIVIGSIKLARRRRRRRGDAASRIAGGWEEVVDAGLDYGYDVPATATRLEYATAVQAVDLSVLARRADTADFSDDPVASGSADQYWSDLAILRASWAHGFTLWERIRAAIAIRSLSARRGAPGRTGSRRG